MANYAVIIKASLRPDPDDSSAELLSLEVGDIIAPIRSLEKWLKVSFTDKAGVTHLGWVRSEALKEVQAQQFQLYDEPFGQAKAVSGNLTEVRVTLIQWQKVRIQLWDGSLAEGWIDSNQATGFGSQTPTGPSQPQPKAPDEADLSLGPNEIYRAPLLKAEGITDIDAAALAALVNAEAAKLPNGQWNSRSTAGSSSAAGLTQFLSGTWIAHAQKNGTLLNQTARTRGFITGANVVVPGQEAALLDLRFDPELSIVSAAEYGLSNLNALVKAGLVDDQLGDDEKARYIYLAHHEGLQGAKLFLNGTGTYSFSDLAKQVGSSGAQSFVDAAGGDTSKAYHDWLDGYIDRNIQPSKFRKPKTSIPGGEGTTALSQFDGAAIPLAELGPKTDLVKAIQWRLMELGYLDPPADGIFGAVTSWALSEFCGLNGISLRAGFSKNIAQTLLNPTNRFPELVASGTWFDKVIVYMRAKKYFICRHPDCKNIVYLEGVNPDGTLNNDAPNVFNDLRIVFSVDRNGRADPKSAIWEGTTEPGNYWTIHPMSPKGAARIAFNQYKAWVVGTHHPHSENAHEALVQASPVTVYRDLNKDFKRPGDEMETGIFAINQHWGYNAPVGDLGRTSAGCLVGRTKDGHREFMALVKDDPRYKVNNSYKFISAIMPGEEILG
jgi:hypothetical protein